MENKILSFFCKLNRLAAWVLFFVFLLFFISGYGLTKGLINYETASSLHLSRLVALGFFTFIIHMSWAFYLVFSRFKIWNKATKIFIALFALISTAGFIYINYFFSEKNNAPASNEISANQENVKIFTKEELIRYNGKNGQPAYVAIDGKIYDLSSLYKNGLHFGCEAGKEITSAFYKKHPATILKMFKTVGVYSEN